MYIVEMAPLESTGFFGTIHQLCISLGFVIVYLLGEGIHARNTAVVGALICGLLCLLVWLVPEPHHTAAASTIAEREPQESLWAGRWMCRLALCLLFMLFQQLSGINAILINITGLFAHVRAGIPPGYISAICASAQVVACVCAGFLIQTFGRKIVWVFSFGGLALTDILYGVTEVPDLKESRTFPPYCPILIIFVNLFCFGVGAGPIPWFIVPEMFPASVRAKAMSIVSSSNWLFAFLVILLFDLMTRDKGMGVHGSFFLYGIISFISSVFGLFYLQKGGEEDQGNEDIYTGAQPSHPGGSEIVSRPPRKLSSAVTTTRTALLDDKDP
jgi:MFS family permease